MRRLGCLALFALLVSGCASTSTSTSAIDDQQQAITIAAQLCASTVGKAMQKQGGAWEVKPSEWHARIDGTSWKVWTGKEASPVLLVHVPRTGPLPTDCDMHFED